MRLCRSPNRTRKINPGSIKDMLFQACHAVPKGKSCARGICNGRSTVITGSIAGKRAGVHLGGTGRAGAKNPLAGIDQGKVVHHQERAGIGLFPLEAAGEGQ